MLFFTVKRDWVPSQVIANKGQMDIGHIWTQCADYRGDGSLCTLYTSTQCAYYREDSTLCTLYTSTQCADSREDSTLCTLYISHNHSTAQTHTYKSKTLLPKPTVTVIIGSILTLPTGRQELWVAVSRLAAQECFLWWRRRRPVIPKLTRSLGISRLHTMCRLQRIQYIVYTVHFHTIHIL